MPRRNALLVSTGTLTPSAVTSAGSRRCSARAPLQTLALEFNVDVPQTAVLTGGSVSSAVGTFNYTPHPDGTVTPDAAWVARPTSAARRADPRHRHLQQGDAAAAAGRAGRGGAAGPRRPIHPGEYAGCYYPRFIANDPAKGLSLHSWGIAVDLNVPGNQRGTVGQMDRRVVAIFKRWGFAWGGDWNYTDPMHFEMAEVVQVGR